MISTTTTMPEWAEEWHREREVARLAMVNARHRSDKAFFDTFETFADFWKVYPKPNPPVSPDSSTVEIHSQRILPPISSI
jgi:hypothetical protein